MKKELGTERISTYWWNFGKKKNDFNGTISEWLKSKDIKVTTIKHPKVPDTMGFRFKYNLGSTINTMDIYSERFSGAAMIVIKLWLTYLGDKALVTGFRNYRINH
jgi:hypothetical protein